MRKSRNIRKSTFHTVSNGEFAKINPYRFTLLRRINSLIWGTSWIQQICGCVHCSQKECLYCTIKLEITGKLLVSVPKKEQNSLKKQKQKFDKLPPTMKIVLNVNSSCNWRDRFHYYFSFIPRIMSNSNGSPTCDNRSQTTSKISFGKSRLVKEDIKKVVIKFVILSHYKYNRKQSEKRKILHVCKAIWCIHTVFIELGPHAFCLDTESNLIWLRQNQTSI